MGVEILRLSRTDMWDAARVHRAAFDERLPWLAGRHTPDEDRAFFEDKVFAACEVWGARDRDVLTAFMAFREGWIDHLYVLPSHQGAGQGGALLRMAKALAPELRLWTFQRNLIARRFYERRGFKAVDMTDGARNEAREPDVLYAWRAAADPREASSRPRPSAS